MERKTALDAMGGKAEDLYPRFLIYLCLSMVGIVTLTIKEKHATDQPVGWCEDICVGSSDKSHLIRKKQGRARVELFPWLL